MKEIFKNYGFYLSRMISSSKSGYRERYPDNQVYFNANIFILGEGKVWWGDLDITLDKDNLECVARDLGKDLFILREMDGRFENEKIKDSEIISKSVCKISK
jgi:hypothetical protein